MKATKPKAALISLISFSTNPTKAPKLQIISTKIHTHALNFCTYAHKNPNNFSPSFIKNGNFLNAHKLLDELPHRDVFSLNRKLSSYIKNGSIDEAKSFFATMKNRNIVTWTIMIGALSDARRFEESFSLFHEMTGIGFVPDSVTIVTVLGLCTNQNSSIWALQIHSWIVKLGFDSVISVCNTLIDAYCKCGLVKSAQGIFQQMKEKDSVTFNALLSGKKAIEMFESLIGSGFEPESVSFLSVLTACNHSGLVEEGLRYFDMMKYCYNLEPRKEHYACMVDMLGRMGRFGKLENMLGQIPFEPDPIIWSSILNSCKIHGNYKLGKLACDKLFQMESKDAGHYMIMSNIYAKEGKWDQVARVKKLMRDRGVIKETAYSWVEINRKIYTFSSNDMRNPRIEEIKAYLDKLSVEMEREGYKPDISSDQHLVGEKTKIEFLRYHSERLAIAFALIGTKDGEIIRVMKNLRTCVDCHEAIKIMTRVVKREIIVRDSSRFHHFKDGVCSCGDYWSICNSYFFLHLFRLVRTSEHTFLISCEKFLKKKLWAC
ncbi:hypothetical protein LUZ60_013490 [Juncus effusus]|nr:hypothetical protein LUZ60_013490 [Juncus effusus]